MNEKKALDALVNLLDDADSGIRFQAARELLAYKASNPGDEVEAVRSASLSLLSRGITSQNIRFNDEFVVSLHDAGWKLVFGG